LAGYGAKAVRQIRKSLSVLSPAGQVLALAALKLIDHKSSTNTLIVLAKKSPIMIRTVAISSLSNRSGKAVDAALRNLLRDKNPTYRALAAEALGKNKRNRDLKRACRALVKSTTDAIIEVRIKALESLGMLTCAQGIQSLINALGSRKKRERLTALFALRFLGDKRAVPAIIEVLRDEDDMVVGDAAKTLKRLTGETYGADYGLWKAWWETIANED
jgi:HEAT repeat protein